MNTQGSGGSRNFAKMRTLKMRSIMTGHPKFTTTTESIIEAYPLKTTGKEAEELNINHSTVV